MNDKGFTLIEMLVTIALLAAISVTVGVSMSGMLTRQDDKDFREFQNNLLNAACLYAELNDIVDDGSIVKASQLVEVGYIKKTNKNPNTDMTLEEYMNNGRDIEIVINWDDEGEKTCECKCDDCSDNC